MRPHIVLFCLVIALANYLGAQPEAQATKILQDLESKIKSHQDITYEFTLKVEWPEDKPLVKKGIFYSRLESYRLDLPDFLIVTNLNDHWVVDKNGKEIQIHDYQTPDPSDLSSPQNILAIYKNPDYEYRLSYSGDRGGEQVHEIEFKPLDRYSEYSKARLTIDDTGNEINKIEVFVKDGTRYHLTIDKFTTDTNLEDSLFAVDVLDFPDYHVEDLRLE